MQGDRPTRANPKYSDREIPLYARLGLQAGAADWLRVALEQTWVQGGSASVFISYATKDEVWRFQLERFLVPELARLRCPNTQELYRPWSFSSLKQGTATGTQFPVELASQLWRCQAAIVLLSQDYLNSPICSATELPFLAWRHAAQKMPLYVLQVGVVSAAAAVISLPQVNGTWPDFDLNNQTNDRFPGLDQRERSAVRQRNIFELRKGPARDRRLAAFAELVRRNLAEQHRGAAEARPSSSHKSPDDNAKGAGPLLRRKSVGVFPQIDAFEGRVTERRILTEALSHPTVGVVALCQIGGAGKTCLALKAIEDLLDKTPPSFEGVFQFTFYGGRSQNEFIQELAMFISDVLNEYRPVEGIEGWLMDMLRRHAFLLLLDGTEVIQSSSMNADVGSLHQGGVRTLLLWLCNQIDIRSTALVTSRLDLRDLSPYRGGRYQPIELPGLSVDDGVRLLQRKGVQASVPVLGRVVTELSGHPLGLMVFANSVHRVKTSRANAAVVVSRKAELSNPGSLASKLGRLLAYYQRAIDETDVKLIASVTVFPDGAPADWLRALLAGPADGKSQRDLTAAEVAERLDRLAREGILQVVPTLSRTEYTAHPVIRESFRAAASGLVETAVQLHLSARPSLFRPKTGPQAIPYVRAVEIYCENGNFSAADKVVSGHLEDGHTLSRLGEWRMVFNLLWQFVQPDRREPCQAALGTERFGGLLPLAIDACIELSEWEIAEELCKLGAGILPPNRLASRQARVCINIGSLTEAERLLRLAILDSSPLDKLALKPLLAEVLRLEGKLRDSWRLLRDWIQYRPTRLDELVTWIWLWQGVALCSAHLWSRVQIGIANRFLNAMDKAAPVLPINVAGRGAFLEWLPLCFTPRMRRTPDQWLRMLELGRMMGDEAARMSIKEGDGGWMIGILESLNGLQKHQDVLNNVPVIVSQLHERSYWRPWVDIEAGRAHFALGQTHLARELAGRAIKQALASGHGIMARSAAELLLELPKAAAPGASDILAQQIVEAIRHDTPSEKEWHLNVPLPGEEGWSDHLAALLGRCVQESPADGRSAFDSALQLAARWAIPGAVPTILARGGRPLFGDSTEQSPLMLAVSGEHTEVVRALLRGVGTLDLSNASHSDIAYAAIALCHVEIAELVLSGATNCTREWLSKGLVEVASSGDERLLDLLLRHGADPRVADESGNLPIVQAAERGNVAILLRLARLTSISSAENSGRTALMAAGEHGQLRVIELLAEMNADVHQLDHNGRSVLDAAASWGGIHSLAHLANCFNLKIDRERHLLPAIKLAEQRGLDAQLRFALSWLDSELGRALNVPSLKPTIRAALKRIATKRKLKPHDPSLTQTGMNIGLVVNARGKMCLVHDQPFTATPLWVGYHVDLRRLEIIFDTGATYPIEWEANSEMDNYLQKIDKILIIRMENKKPVEGYDTSFLRLRDGKTID
jgi:ankyrin repeat protein